MTMKIQNYTGTADTFTWSYNPQVYDTTSDNNYQTTPIDFQRHHIIISGGGVNPKNIILTGHFSGTSKMTHWRNCSKHFGETTKIKKLYFESDKFYMGIGKQIKRTHSGGRTNFIDYVATFESFIPVLFGDTAKTSGTNEGNVKTFVHSITGTVTSGASDIVIADDVGNEITIDASELTTGDTFTYKLVEMVQSGTSTIYVSKFGYVEIDGTYTANVRRTAGYGLLQLAAGANITTVTTSNITSPVKTFRDGYYD